MKLLTKPQYQNPIFDCCPGVFINDKVECDEKKREGCSVIATRFCCQEVAKMCWNMFVCPFSTNDCGSEDGVCWGEARSDCKRREERKAWYQGVDQPRRHKPSLPTIVSQMKYFMQMEKKQGSNGLIRIAGGDKCILRRGIKNIGGGLPKS